MPSGFDDAGRLRQIADALLSAWGYAFYLQGKSLRADDQLVRSKAAWLIGLAAATVHAAEAAFRREAIAPPTRARPFPDPSAMAAAQTLERLAKAVGALAARLSSLPAPDQDAMARRARQQADLLIRLIAADQQLVGQAQMLRDLVEGQGAAWLLVHLSAVEDCLTAIQATLTAREALLHGSTA